MNNEFIASQKKDTDGSSHLLVSILIPAYKADFFDQCLSSALSQTYSNIEIIVSDDCPTDAIYKVVCDRIDDRIRYYRNTPAHGPALNYSESLKLAKGNYIKYLNDDDVLHPECVEKMVVALSQGSVSLVTTSRQFIDDNEVSLSRFSLLGEDVIIEGKSLASAMLLNKINLVGEPTCIMFDKISVESVKPHLLCFGGYGYEKSGLGDVGLSLNLLRQGDCAYLGKEALAEIRVFDGQWGKVSNARFWALRTWKEFEKRAEDFGMLDRSNSRWNIRYKEKESGNLKTKYLVSVWLFKSQVHTCLISLKNFFVKRDDV